MKTEVTIVVLILNHRNQHAVEAVGPIRGYSNCCPMISLK